MNPMISLSARRILPVLLVFVLSYSLIAQRGSRGTAADDNFNSPTPILLSETNSTRAIAEVRTFGRGRSTSLPVKPKAFMPGSVVTLYVSNLALLPDEGASALRVYAEDRRGARYRFRVLGLRQAATNVWAVTVLLSDEVGYFPAPRADGDVLIYLTWRGIASNKLRLGLGRTGGNIREDAFARPTPLGTTSVTKLIETIPDARGSDKSRFVEQAGFGPTPTTETSFGGIRLSRWIQNQFLLPYPSASNPYPNQPLKPVNAPTNCDGPNGDTSVPDVPDTCFRDTYSMYPIQTWNTKEMLYGDNPLRHKVSWALSQIWVTSGVDLQQSRWMVEYHKVLSNNAFGNFRSLMEDMTKNAAMGEYLSMNQSTRNNPNENYAREIMQLFTIGLFMLNPDGTVQCYENNPCLPGDTPIPTYDQNVVNNLTRVFTGWNFCQSNNANCPNIFNGTIPPGVPNFIDPMFMNVTNNHDTGSKTLLTYPNAVNTTINACANCTNNLANTQNYASSTMDQALDNIFNHPNVGPFISKLLIQHMVTSDPTPAYVARVASRFNDNGSGVRGDLKAVISAILLDPEARGDVKTDPNYGKLREPMQFATGMLRALNVKSADGLTQSDGVLADRGIFTGMGQVPFRSPTVFNYYPPDFVVPGTSLLGPEFALMTTGTAIQRTNFVNRMVGYQNNGTALSGAPIPMALPDMPLGTSLDMSDLQTISTADATGNALLDELDRRMLHRTMSASMRATLLTAVTAIAPTDPAGRVRQAVYLVATSSQYQVQR